MGKPRFTLEQHTDLGMELALMSDKLARISVMVHNAYPQTSKAYQAASPAMKYLFRLRSELEEELFRESESAGTNIYFPDRRNAID